jgi:hypothetical protein
MLGCKSVCVPGSWFRVLGLGFRVEGLGSGSVFRV